MPIELTANEARVIGCLMEKARVTPDQYPLTLNALTNACNQKSSRDPVMSLEPGTVQGTIRSLESKHLVRTEENFKTQVEKYTQRLCNTPFADYEFDPPQYAVMCVLLLRGSRTPGELKSNSGRLHDFADNQEVEEALASLMNRDGGPVVVELPRAPGRRDPEYMHLLSGPIEISNAVTSQTATRPASPSTRSHQTTQAAQTTITPEIDARVAALEEEVARLTVELAQVHRLLVGPDHDSAD